MKIIDYILLAVIVSVLILAVRRMRHRKSGCCGCQGCESQGKCNTCSDEQKPKK